LADTVSDPETNEKPISLSAGLVIDLIILHTYGFFFWNHTRTEWDEPCISKIWLLAHMQRNNITSVAHTVF